MEVVFETKIVSLRIAEVMVEVVTDEKEKDMEQHHICYGWNKWRGKIYARKWKWGSQKLLHQGHFWWCSKFVFSPCKVVPGACLSQIVTNSDTSNTHKHPQRVVLPHFRERVDESPRQDENFGTFGLFLAFFVSELRPFKVKTNFSNVFWRPCSLIPLMHCS